MADYLPPLVASLVLNAAQFNAGLAEAGAVAKAETTGMGTAFNGLAAVGKVALFGTAAAVGVIGVASIKMAGDFEQATNRLVTSAGEQQANIGAVRSGLLQMAGEVGNSAMDLAGAYYVASSAGYNYAHGGLDVVRAAAEGAKAEGADLKVVTDAVTSAMIDYHQPASNAAQVTTTLIAGVSQGKTTFQELTGSLHSVLPDASATHIAFSEIVADVASMTVHGMSADQATQNLDHTIQHLNTTTPAQNKELALLGINARDLSANLGQRGLAGTLQMIADRIRSDMGPSGQVILQMQTALKGLPPEVQKLGASVIDGSVSLKDFTSSAKGLNVEQAGLVHQFATLMTSTHGIGSAQQSGAQLAQTYAAALKAATGDSTTLNTALMLTGENADYTNHAIKAVSGATTEAGGHVAGWSSIQGTLNQHIDKWKYGLEAAAIQLGTVLIPYVIKAMTAIEGLVDWLGRNQQVTIPLAAAIGGILLVAIGAYTIAMVQAAIATIAATWPLLLVVAAVALVSAGIAVLIMHWQQVRQWILNVAGAISGFIQQHTLLAVAIGIVLGPIGILIGLGALLITHWQQVSHIAMEVANVVKNFVVAHWQLLVGAILVSMGPIGWIIGAAALIITHWKQVSGFFGELIRDVGSFFSRLGTMASKAWEEFARHPLYWVGYIVAFVPIKLAELVVAFDAWAAGMVLRAVQWALDMIAKAELMAGEFYLAVSAELAALPGQVWTWLGNVLPAVARWQASMGLAAFQAAEQFGKSLNDEMGKLPGQMVTLGVNIVQGVINGIKSMASAGAGAIGDFVHGLVAGANAAAGNPHSPAPATIPLGMSLGQGIEYGITASAPGARNAMVGLVSGTTGVGAGGVNVGVGAGTPSASLMQPGSSPASMDDTNELLAQLYQLLDERLPRGRAAGFSNRAYGPA